MGTIVTLISDSLKEIIALSDGEIATAEAVEDGKRKLQELLQSWAAEGLMVPYLTTETFAGDSTKSAYLWATGGDFNSATPNVVRNVSFVLATYQKDLVRMDRRGYGQLPVTGTVSEPRFFMYELQSAGGYFYLDCAPYAGSLKITSEKPLDTTFELTDAVEFPAHYTRALRTNLAIDLAPSYDKTVSAELARNARESKNTVRRFNAQPAPTMQHGVPGQRRTYLPLRSA